MAQLFQRLKQIQSDVGGGTAGAHLDTLLSFKVSHVGLISM